mgnify:CR=1 FL=1
MTGCICEGNWRKIVGEYEPLIGKKYKGYDGETYTFFGLVHGSDDYYYGMCNRDLTKGVKLLSCVGSIEGHGFEEVK